MKKLLVKYKIFFVAFIIAIAGFFYVKSPTKTKEAEHSYADVVMTEEEVYVYVSGAVVAPGVYKLSSQSRIGDAVELAGGFRQDAYIDNINLAAFVYDTERIHILTCEEKQALYDSELVNINEASKEKLITLPGIGSARAQAIIEYRSEHGRFETIEDIMKVAGIKEAAFEKIKDLIVVD